VAKVQINSWPSKSNTTKGTSEVASGENWRRRDCQILFCSEVGRIACVDIDENE
jgi:hypothetical protein